MKNTLLALVSILCFNVCDAQNLVPNGSFEQYTQCPSSYSQITFATHWYVPSTTSSTDYFNVCSTFPDMGVPVNQGGKGYQWPHSGVAYAGIYIWYMADHREYLEVTLDSALTANSCYSFTMYVNLSNACRFSTSTIGAYLSDTMVTDWLPLSIPLTQQISNQDGNMFDTLNWTTVKGNYIAHGGERYLVLGNFKDNSNSDTLTINTGSQGYFVYVYIDDVSLTPGCTTDITENTSAPGIQIFPNPTNGNFVVETPTGNAKGETVLEIYNLSGIKVYQTGIANTRTEVQLTVPAGFYFYKIKGEQHFTAGGKLVVE